MTLTPSPDLALAGAVHRIARGGSTQTLLQLLAGDALPALRADAGSAAVLLGEPGRSLTVHAMAVGDGAPVPSEELLGSGPARAAATTGAMATINDTAAPGQRWPEYAERAVAAGLRGVRCWPIRVTQAPVGALVVHTPDTWGTGRSNSTGQAMADLCGVVLQLPGQDERWAGAAAYLHSVLVADVAVHQAAGMLAAAHHIEIPAAAAALRGFADRLGRSVPDVARQLVRGELELLDVPVR